MRAAKPRWHSSGSRPLLPASSWPAKIIWKRVRALCPAAWSFTARRQAHGVTKHQENSGSQGAGHSYPQVAAKLLHAGHLYSRASTPGCLLLSECSPDAVQVNSTATYSSCARASLCSAGAWKFLLLHQSWASLPKRMSKKQLSHSLPAPHRKELCLSKPTSLFLRKKL